MEIGMKTLEIVILTQPHSLLFTSAMILQMTQLILLINAIKTYKPILTCSRSLSKTYVKWPTAITGHPEYTPMPLDNRAKNPW